MAAEALWADELRPTDAAPGEEAPPLPEEEGSVVARLVALTLLSGSELAPARAAAECALAGALPPSALPPAQPEGDTPFASAAAAAAALAEAALAEAPQDPRAFRAQLRCLAAVLAPPPPLPY